MNRYMDERYKLSWTHDRTSVTAKESGEREGKDRRTKASCLLEGDGVYVLLIPICALTGFAAMRCVFPLSV